MKKMILLALALATAAVSQAVTVAWYVPNSDLGSWATQSALEKIYIVYSTTAFSDADNYVAAYNAATAGGSTVQGILDTTVGTKLGVYASGLAAPTTNVNGEFAHDAYYYMVAVSTDPTPLYAVAGVGPITSTTDATSKGIYDNDYGDPPGVGDYVDLNNWLGGTWTDAIVPEPTVMALLALGVAGMALRRKEKVL